MAENNLENANSGDARREPYAFYGRWAGIALYWVVAIYMVTVAFVSIVPQVFYQPSMAKKAACCAHAGEDRHP